jgi:Holliday junction resolvasome RuvABC endonuclease subunit
MDLDTVFRSSFGIDQALDKTGVSCVLIFTKIELQSHYTPLANLITKLNPSEEERFEEILDLFSRYDQDSPLPYALVLPPLGRQRKETTLGFLVKTGDRFLALLTGTVDSSSALDQPEWARIRESSRRTLRIIEEFLHLDQSLENGGRSLIGMEGLALGGNPQSRRNLVVLGAVYARYYEELASNPAVFERVREAPISSWKKLLTGKAKAKKKEILGFLEGMGLVFARASDDDKADALSIALVASREDANAVLKNRKGKMLT